MIKSPCTPIPIPEGTVIDRILRTLKEQSISNPDKAAIVGKFKYISIHSPLPDRCFRQQHLADIQPSS